MTEQPGALSIPGGNSPTRSKCTLENNTNDAIFGSSFPCQFLCVLLSVVLRSIRPEGGAEDVLQHGKAQTIDHNGTVASE